MAFFKYAYAKAVAPAINGKKWSRVRTASGGDNKNLIAQASEILGEDFNPDKYLLTHCTIVCSVDTEPAGSGIKLGRIVDPNTGNAINRKWADYRVKPYNDKHINNNQDAWPRPVLMKSYRTFVGGHNFCFVPGTKVLMGDGTYRPIQDISVGDEVTSREGHVRKVVHRFEREYEGEIVEIYLEGHLKPIVCTPNHSFPILPKGKTDIQRVESGLFQPGDRVIPLGQKLTYSILGVERRFYRGRVHNIEVDVDHSYVVEGICTFNCEHVQKLEESKGRILDAVARDIGESVYVDILVATDRRHKALVRDIQAGKMGTLSMGCSVTETTCTKCGNVSADETQLCNHIRYEKGNYFYDERGNKHRVAELCGHNSIEPNGGVNFIEASWVAAPAFGGAVMRNILEPTGMSQEMLRQAQKVLNEPPPQWVEGGIAKAANRLVQVPSTYDDEVLGFDFDEGGDEGKDDGDTQDDSEKKPFDQLQDDVYQEVLDRVNRRITDDLAGRNDQPSSAEPEHSTNDDIVKQARQLTYQLGVDAIVKSASSDAHLIDSLARFNARMGVQVPRALYLAALELGPLSKYGSVEEWAVKAHSSMHRTPSLGETKTLLRLGKLLDQMAESHQRRV